MGVVSRDIQAEHRTEKRQRRRSFNLPNLMLGLLGVIIGSVMWVSGARYTVDGALIVVNWMRTGTVRCLSVSLSQHPGRSTAPWSHSRS